MTKSEDATDGVGDSDGTQATEEPVAPQRSRRMTAAHDESRDSGTYVALPMLRSYTVMSRIASVKSAHSIKSASILINDVGGRVAELNPEPVEGQGLVNMSQNQVGMAQHMEQGSKRLNAREMKGYLEKRGGMKGTKGWDHRWFHLDSENKKLFYFHY